MYKHSKEEEKKIEKLGFNTWSYPLSFVSQSYRVTVTDWSKPSQKLMEELTWDYVLANGKVVGFPKPANGCPQSIEEIVRKKGKKRGIRAGE